MNDTRLTTSLTAIAVAAVLVFATTGQYAFGDNIQNDIAVNAVDISAPPGGTVSVQYYIQVTGAGDGAGGAVCDPTTFGNPTIGFSFSPVSPAVGKSPGTITFSACDSNPTAALEGAKTVVFTVPASASPGDTFIVTPTIDNPNGGTYNPAPGVFTITVESPPAPTDTTAPAISYTVNGVFPAVPDGDNGWYKTNAFVDWTVTDGESIITSTIGCVDTTINSDTSGTTLSCTATSSGGTAGPVSVTIKRDATAPTISGSTTPAPNLANWNNGDVTVSFTCADALSGIATCEAAQVLGEGADQSVTGTAKDNAGNTNTATVSNIDVDETAPGITGSPSPAANANGWNNSPVTVTFTCTDGLSGIKSCTSPITLSSEGAGQSASGTAVDNADNSQSITVTGLNIDLTAPTISGAATTAPNGNDWYNGPVTIHFTCSDALSTIDSCPADVTLSSEGAAQSVTRTAYDKAGNSASATVSGINIDTTKPSITVPSSYSVYSATIPAVVTYTGQSFSDALSGLDGAGACSPASPATLTLGTSTVSCTATDKAGNTDTKTFTITVYQVTGFYQPVDMGIYNKGKAGNTIPFKFNIYGGTGEITDTSIVKTFKKAGVACTGGAADDIETYSTTGGSVLRYDTTGHQFVYNVQSLKTEAGKCFSFTLILDDGSTLGLATISAIVQYVK